MATTAAMLPHEAAIVADVIPLRVFRSVIAHEAEFGRALPDGSFYKSLALQICRKYGIKVK